MFLLHVISRGDYGQAVLNYSHWLSTEYLIAGIQNYHAYVGLSQLVLIPSEMHKNKLIIFQLSFREKCLIFTLYDCNTSTQLPLSSGVSARKYHTLLLIETSNLHSSNSWDYEYK